MDTVLPASETRQRGSDTTPAIPSGTPHPCREHGHSHLALRLLRTRLPTALRRRRLVCAGVRCGKIDEECAMAIEELRVHTETDGERVGAVADKDTERL